MVFRPAATTYGSVRTDFLIGRVRLFAMVSKADSCRTGSLCRCCTKTVTVAYSSPDGSDTPNDLTATHGAGVGAKTAVQQWNTGTNVGVESIQPKRSFFSPMVLGLGIGLALGDRGYWCRRCLYAGLYRRWVKPGR